MIQSPPAGYGDAPASKTLSFERFEWLFPIAVTVHNLEEAIWLPGFVASLNQPPWQVSPGVFRCAIVVLTAAAWMVTYLSLRQTV